MYWVYILYSEKFGQYYKGVSDNHLRRLEEHNNGKEASTSRYRPWTLVWKTKKESLSEARKLERKLKNLSQERTRLFIKKYSSL
jgi:putative endonuclease